MVRDTHRQSPELSQLLTRKTHRTRNTVRNSSKPEREKRLVSHARHAPKNVSPAQTAQDMVEELLDLKEKEDNILATEHVSHKGNKTSVSSEVRQRRCARKHGGRKPRAGDRHPRIHPGCPSPRAQAAVMDWHRPGRTALVSRETRIAVPEAVSARTAGESKRAVSCGRKSAA